MPSTHQYLLLWLSFSLVSPESQPGVMDNVQVYATLCPSSVCNSTQREILQREDKRSCCQRCSCPPDCYKVANCCPDITLSTPSEPEYPCIRIDQLLNDERQIVNYKDYSLQYRVVNKCPDQNSTQTFTACENPVSLQDYIPVSDKMYDRVYRNSHCAMCHGVQEYIVWDLTTECAEIESASFETFKERDEHILNNCAIMAFPPESIKTDVSRCYFDLHTTIDACNITRERNFYDQGMKNACHTINTSYNTVYTYLREDGLTLKFRNVNCFLCNTPKDFYKSYTCELPDTEPMRSGFIGFSAVLNFWSVDTSVKADQCRSVDIWDRFDAVCRRLLCPKGTIPVYGSCQNSSLYSEGFQIGLTFELTSATTVALTSFPSILQNILDPFTDNVTDILDPNYRCGRCQSTNFRYLNETNVYIEVPFFTTKYCSNVYLIRKLLDIVSTQKLKFTANSVVGPLHVIPKATFREMPHETRRVLTVLRHQERKLVSR